MEIVENWKPLSYLGPIYTSRSQGRKNLGPILSIFGFLFGLKLLINARTLAPIVANWLPKLDGILFFFFQPWGPIEGHKLKHLLLTWGRFKNIFSISALTPSVKPLLGAIFNFYSNRNAWFIWVEHWPWLLVWKWGLTTNAQQHKMLLCHT